ncbi:MAG: Dyp-type peroxidase [Gemmatimonadaceae bacterium]
MSSLLQRLFHLSKVNIELDDIQAVILRNRPIPYFGTNALLHFESAAAGRELIKKLLPLITSAEDWHQAEDASATIAFTFEGLRILRLPDASLDSFPESFREGMAKRAVKLNDVDEHAPEHWQKPFGTGQIHAAVNIIADTHEKWQHALEKAKAELGLLGGVTLLHQADFAATEEAKNVFGYRDGISNPTIEGSGVDEVPGFGKPIKAGEFILGYPGESGAIGKFPDPELLGKNGTFLVFRKYHSNVYLFNKFLKDNANTDYEQELLAAKMFGRWRSGAPLTLTPEKDDHEIGADAHRNNNFSYEEDELGKTVPLSCHMRRMNPRDTKQSVMSDVNLHRIIRKGVSYGSAPHKDAVIDDGEQRGLYFIAISAKAMDTVEHLQSQWVNEGNFINHGDEKDPIIGLNQGKGLFTVPGAGERRRYHAIETFNVMQGGEYFFLPGLRALKWMSEL